MLTIHENEVKMADRNVKPGDKFYNTTSLYVIVLIEGVYYLINIETGSKFTPTDTTISSIEREMRLKFIREDKVRVTVDIEVGETN